MVENEEIKEEPKEIKEEVDEPITEEPKVEEDFEPTVFRGRNNKLLILAIAGVIVIGAAFIYLFYLGLFP